VFVEKFCGRCKKELPADARYLLCDSCHKKVALSEDDREFYENSRVHWR
jgi:predicted amidophosphoribosyltransferase